VAAGADAVFLETHPEPTEALCDAMSMIRLDTVEGILVRLKAIREALTAGASQGAGQGR
jgi:2-dehydro-3-deoxyphosphooctonate aldolase (KDO 8-P synthase)